MFIQLSNIKLKEENDSGKGGVKSVFLTAVLAFANG